jgi:fructan beta-fructosidase
VDWTDSSGLFGGRPGLVAIYTSTAGGEAQSIAYSRDKGRTWERYKENPVIPNPGIKDFRDPKVFWHEETGRWVMVVSTGDSVSFYRSRNLIDWEYLSNFGAGYGTHVAVWECPDLFKLPVDGNPNRQKWVLHVSVGDNNITNGSTAQYFVGEFDGVGFKADNPPETVLITDIGQDFYAAQSFSDIPKEDGRRIWLAWMANWRYPYQSPTRPWKGSLSIPRVLSLKTTNDGKLRLVQEPIDELKRLRVTEYRLGPFVLSGEQEIENFTGSTFEFDVVVEWEHTDEFGIKLRASDDEETVIGLDRANNTVFVDRSKAGLEWLVDRNGALFRFGRRYQAFYPPQRKQVRLHGFVDESSIEIFVNDGEMVFTNLIYTRPTNRAIKLYARGGRVRVASLRLYHLRSIWRPESSFDAVERIVLSDEYLSIPVNGTQEVKAGIKPDWTDPSGRIDWEVEDPTIADVLETTPGRAVLRGLQPGGTRLRARVQGIQVSAEIPVWVTEESELKLELDL